MKIVHFMTISVSQNNIDHDTLFSLLSFKFLNVIIFEPKYQTSKQVNVRAIPKRKYILIRSFIFDKVFLSQNHVEQDTLLSLNSLSGNVFAVYTKLENKEKFYQCQKQILSEISFLMQNRIQKHGLTFPPST